MGGVAERGGGGCRVGEDGCCAWSGIWSAQNHIDSICIAALKAALPLPLGGGRVGAERAGGGGSTHLTSGS